MSYFNNRNKGPRNKKNKNNYNNTDYNYSQDFIDIPSDYKYPNAVNVEVKEKETPVPSATKNLKIDAPKFIPKTYSTQPAMAEKTPKNELGTIIQQDKFFFNNKFNLNSSNQNMMINTLLAIPSQDVIVSLPQNPLLNPYLNGQTVYDKTLKNQTDLNNSLNRNSLTIEDISKRSSMKKKLDINSEVYFKKDNKNLNRNSLDSYNKYELNSPFRKDSGDLLFQTALINKVDLNSHSNLINCPNQFTFIESLKFNNESKKTEDCCFKSNSNVFNSEDFSAKLDLESAIFNSELSENKSKQNLNDAKFLNNEKNDENLDLNLTEKNEFQLIPTIDNLIQKNKIPFEAIQSIEEKTDNNENSTILTSKTNIVQDVILNKTNDHTEVIKLQDNQNLFKNQNEEKSSIKKENLLYNISIDQPIQETSNLLDLAVPKTILDSTELNFQSNCPEDREINKVTNSEVQETTSRSEQISQSNYIVDQTIREINNITNSGVPETIPGNEQISETNTPLDQNSKESNNIPISEAPETVLITEPISQINCQLDENSKEDNTINEDYYNIMLTEESSLQNQNSLTFINDVKDMSNSIDFAKTMKDIKKNYLKIETDEEEYDDTSIFLKTCRNTSRLCRIPKIIGKVVKKESFKTPLSSYKQLVSPRTSGSHKQKCVSQSSQFDNNKDIINKIINQIKPIIEEKDFIENELRSDKPHKINHVEEENNSNFNTDKIHIDNDKTRSEKLVSSELKNEKYISCESYKDHQMNTQLTDQTSPNKFRLEERFPLKSEFDFPKKNSENIEDSSEKSKQIDEKINCEENLNSNEKVTSDILNPLNCESNKDNQYNAQLTEQINPTEVELEKTIPIKSELDIPKENSENIKDSSEKSKQIEENINNEKDLISNDKVSLDDSKINNSITFDINEKNLTCFDNENITYLNNNSFIKQEDNNKNISVQPEEKNFYNDSNYISYNDFKNNLNNKMDYNEDISKFSTGNSINQQEEYNSKIKKIEIKKEVPEDSKINNLNDLLIAKQNPSSSNSKSKNFRKKKGPYLTTVNIDKLRETQSKDNQIVTPKTDNIKPVFEIQKHYFKVRKGEEVTKIKKYSEEYIMHFKNWKISQESKLITDVISSHFEQMKVFTEEKKIDLLQKKKHKHNKKDYFNQQSEIEQNKPIITKSPNVSELPIKPVDEVINFPRMSNQNESNIITTVGIGNWARRNLAEAEKEATDYKGKLDNELKIDPITDELTEILNKSTLDNYEAIKTLIFEKIKSSVENQEKFLHVLFKKAIVEKSYVVIYARLCKDLDNELPQKVEEKKSSKPNTIFRLKLIEKCRKIFKEEISLSHTKFSVILEKEQFEKDFILGNVNFIGELIKSRILSKIVVFQCMDHLKNDKEKLINIEGIVMLLDKFGTEINSTENIKKIKPRELKELNDKLESYFTTLSEIAEKNQSLPGFIRYKIINLIEKKIRGWQESKVDTSLRIKSLKEVHDEFEQEIIDNTSTVTNYSNNKNNNRDYVKKQLLNDLILWKTLKQEEKDENLFDWKNIENLIKDKYSVASILNSFGDVIIDFLKDLTDCEYCFLYINNIIHFYSYNLNKKIKNEIVDVALDYLSYINDLSLDNKLLIDMWAYILFSLFKNKIFVSEDFEKLTNITDEQYSVIYEVACRTVQKFPQKEQSKFFNEFNKLIFFKVKQTLFQNIKNKI